MSTNNEMYHTTAIGIEPIEKVWNVGAQKVLERGGGGYSPFPRINRLRELYFSTQLTLDATRVKVFTEVYKENEAQPMVIKKAKALAKFMEVCELSYEEGELVLLGVGSPNFAAGVYPEYVGHYVYDELRAGTIRGRGFNPMYHDDETAEEILKTEEYWKGKSTGAVIRARLKEDAAKGSAFRNMPVFNPNVNVDFSVGHMTPNYAYALEKGLGGIKADVFNALEKLGCPITVDEIKAYEFHQAQLILLDGIMTYFKRYEEYAKKLIDKYEDSQTKDELKSLSAICAKLGNGDSPSDFWEAVQLVYAVFAIMCMEQNGHAIALGRFDQYMYPFYKKSLDEKIYTKEFMQSLIDGMFLKMHTYMQLSEDNEMWRGGSRGYPSFACIVCGVDRDGNDATNDLSFMVLDSIPHLRTNGPYVTVRVHKKLPYEVKVKATNVIRVATGHPKMLNDDVCIPALMRHGVSLEDARDYVNIGCVELEVPGKTLGWHDVCGINLAKVFELAINNGRHSWDPESATPLGLETGYLKDMKSIDEVKSAYEAQLKYWADRTIETVNLLQDIHAEVDELPWASTMIEGCTETGKTLYRGGAKYNFTGITAVSPATVSDSLSVLKQVVFEEKKVTPEEMQTALKCNWQGYERLRKYIDSDKVHHWGNDDDYADEMFKYVYNLYTDLLQSYPPTRGGIGIIKTNVFTQIINIMFGLPVGATPDGRCMGVPLAANMEPGRIDNVGNDRNGPTALARSYGKVDHSKCAGGTLVNFKFGADTMSGEKGLKDFINFIDGYFAQGAQHTQIMVADRETLIEAKAKPEEYQDLMVRVSGFSAYFHTLSPEFQDELIYRTESSFD